MGHLFHARPWLKNLLRGLWGYYNLEQDPSALWNQVTASLALACHRKEYCYLQMVMMTMTVKGPYEYFALEVRGCFATEYFS